MPVPSPFGLHRLALRGLRAAGVLTLGLALAGCDDPGGPMGPARVQVLGGAVTVAAPSGYCVSPETGQRASDTAVVLIGRCQAAGLVAPALISVSVGPSGSGGVMASGGEALAGFFAGPAGLKLLAKSGRARDVTLKATAAEGDALLLRLSDASAGDYWRAMLALGGRLITVSAQGTGGLALTEAASRAAVEQTLAALRAANPARAAVVGPPEIPAEGATAAPPPRPAAG